MKNVKNLPHASGIYIVTNNFNNACYIGQSKDIYKRFNSHHLIDYKNPNNCCYNTKFYKILRSKGIDNFEVNVLELCDASELDDKEIYYINKYDAYFHGYNSTPGGQFWSDDIHSIELEEKRQKTREANQSLKGENHPRAKLTNEEVITIRQRYIQGETPTSIYQDYSHLYSSFDTFKRIIFGYTYKDVGNVPSAAQIRKTNAKFTDVQIREIREKYKPGQITYEQLGKEYGASPNTIERIVHYKTYKNVN